MKFLFIKTYLVKININIINPVLIFILIINFTNSHAKLTPEIQDFVGNRYFYIGIGSGYNAYKFENKFINIIHNNNISIKQHAINTNFPIVGLKLQGNYSVGMELGKVFYSNLNFQDLTSGKKLDNKLKINNTFFNLTGYLPLIKDRFNNLKSEIFIGLGGGHLAIKETGLSSFLGANNSYQKYGLHAKLGIQYNFYNSFNIRCLLGYQKVGHKSKCYSIDSFKFINLDLIYIL